MDLGKALEGQCPHTEIRSSVSRGADFTTATWKVRLLGIVI